MIICLHIIECSWVIYLIYKCLCLVFVDGVCDFLPEIVLESASTSWTEYEQRLSDQHDTTPTSAGRNICPWDHSINSDDYQVAQTGMYNE